MSVGGIGVPPLGGGEDDVDMHVRPLSLSPGSDVEVQIGEEMKGDLPPEFQVSVDELKKTGLMDVLKAVKAALPAGVGVTLWGVGVGGAFILRLTGGLLDVAIEIASKGRSQGSLFSEAGYVAGLAFGTAIGGTGAILANKLGGVKELTPGIDFRDASGRLSAATLLQKYYSPDKPYERLALIELINAPITLAEKIYDALKSKMKTKPHMEVDVKLTPPQSPSIDP